MKGSYIYKIVYETDSGLYNIYYDKIEQIYNLIKPCIKSIERINDGSKVSIKIYDHKYQEINSIIPVYFNDLVKEEKILIQYLYNLSRL